MKIGVRGMQRSSKIENQKQNYDQLPISWKHKHGLKFNQIVEV